MNSVKIYPDIAPVYSKDFPEDYINDINGWAFSEEEVNKNLGRLLTLDIEFGIKCSLNCPHCFRKDSRIDVLSKEMLNFTELKSVILDAKKLGLKSVKILGKGEPFEEPRILDLIDFLNKNNIIPLIFTKGHILGNNEKVQKIFQEYNISSSKKLLSILFDKNVSIMLGLNSFYPEVQNKMVGNGYWYTSTRNKALELLVDAGFNKCNPTRLAIVPTPITKENINEAFEIYTWGRERNLYVPVAPTMISGRAHNNDFWRGITPSEKELIDLYTSIYIYNINHKLQTLAQVEREGISAYAGGHPCNQVSVGMYITINGLVLRCPGDDVTILGNLRQQFLKKIWENSENHARCGRYNCYCPPKWGKSIPYNFFRDVLVNVKNYYRIN